jgi:hypothetical protein
MADEHNDTTVKMGTGEALQLASRLLQRAKGTTLSEQVGKLESDGLLASRLIHAMLRQVHSSDVFTLDSGDDTIQQPRQTN